MHVYCNILSIDEDSKDTKHSAVYEKLFINVRELIDITEQPKERHNKTQSEINHKDQEILIETTQSRL